MAATAVQEECLVKVNLLRAARVRRRRRRRHLSSDRALVAVDVRVADPRV